MIQNEPLLKSTFTTGDIANTVEVNRSVIADWLARGIVSAPQAPGRGHSRRFSFWNVVECWITRDLNRMGIRAGSISVILEIARTEYFQFNTALKARGGQEDCVLMIGFARDGGVEWIRREGPPERSMRSNLHQTVVVLRIDVNAAMSHVEGALKKRKRR
jgi:hypothetical protein